MDSLRIKKMTYSALFLAIALVLPFITGQIPEIGAMLCPMHIPALLCGFMCGWPWGLAVGLIGMPAMFPSAVGMAFELAVYGMMSGLLYRLLAKKKWAVYASLLIAMIAGRIVWGTVRMILAGAAGLKFTWAMFQAGAFTNAVPGIILQIILIPILVIALNKAGHSLNK